MSARSTSSRPVRAKPPASASASSLATVFPVFLKAAALLAMALLVYFPATQAGFIWDDDDMLTENPLMRGGLGDIWFTTKFYDYYPLTLTSLWIEWRLWGMNPMGYHVTNILLHAVTSILFWRVLLRLRIPGAWFAALVFAVHPVNVESVAWIAERKNTLPMVFYALSILWFVRAENEKTNKWFWLSLTAFVLALLSKTSVVMLPFVLLGCLWWLHGKLTAKDVLRTLPFFAVALVFALITIWMQYNRAIATDVVQAAGFWERLARAGWAVWFYLSKTLVSLNLSFVYPRWEIDPSSVMVYVPGLAVLGWLAVFWKFRDGWGKAPLLGFGYFVVTLFPVLGFFNIYFQKYSFVADHWQYTSIIGIIALVTGAATHALRNHQTAQIISACAVALLLGIVTWKQCYIYQNDETLWRDTLKKNPQAAIAHHNLGILAAERGDLAQAMTHFRSALDAQPDHEGAHYGLGTAFALQGNFTQALPHLREAVRIKPDFSMALNTLAWILATHPSGSIRNGAEAVRHAQKAVDLSQERNAVFLDTLAAAQAEAGRFEEAVRSAQKAAELARAENPELLGDITARIKLYQSGRPYRERLP